MIPIVALSFLGCQPTIHIYKDQVVYEDRTIDLYNTTLFEIDSVFGFSEDSVDCNSYSYEKFYKDKSISFAYEQEDPSRTANWFNAKMDENKIFIDGKRLLPKNLIVKNLIKIFGEGQWSYNTSLGLAIEYDNFDFYIELRPEDKSLISDFKESDWAKNYDHFKFNKVIEIEVY